MSQIKVSAGSIPPGSQAAAFLLGPHVLSP